MRKIYANNRKIDQGHELAIHKEEIQMATSCIERCYILLASSDLGNLE